MKRTFQLLGLVVTVLLVCSRPAEANGGWWDWLEDLSGPGPFHSRKPYNLMLTLICTDTGVTGAERLFKFPDYPKDPKPGEPAKQPTCLFYDQRFLRTDADTRFGTVDATMIEIGPYVRLHRSFEVGAGVGFIHFSSTRADGTRLTPTQVTVSFPRLVFMPLAAIPFGDFQTNSHWGFFKMYYKETIIGRELNETNFALAAGSTATFKSRYGRVRSTGFIIDGAELGRLIEHYFH
jgi:hypothetical protein